MIDRALGIVGIAVTVLTAVSARTKKQRRAGIAVGMALLAAAVIVFFWPEGVPPPSGSSTNQSGGQTGGTINNNGPVFNGPVVPPATTSLDQSILLECDISEMPDKFPSSGRIYTLEIQDAVHSDRPSIEDYGEMYGKPEASMKWPKTMYQAIECRFTNYGSNPVLNVQAALTVEFREAIKHKDGNGSEGGAVIKTIEWKTPRAYLGTGDQNTFIFYIWSHARQFVMISLPTTALVQAVGSDKWQTVQLVPPPPTSGLFLSPANLN